MSDPQRLTLAEVDRRFASLRLTAPDVLRRLRASIEREGIRDPVVVSSAVETDRWVLLDGFKRVRVAEELELPPAETEHEYLDRLRVSAAHREIAPGAEEFAPPATGPWLPPERTFSEYARAPLRSERIDHLELAGERELGGAVVTVRAFRQQVDDQLVTTDLVDINVNIYDFDQQVISHTQDRRHGGTVHVSRKHRLDTLAKGN